MANSKAIKSQIKSIWNIQKITSALEIVSTVKLQKVKTKADKFKEYMIESLFIFDKVGLYSDVFSFAKDINSNKELIVIVSTEKWLCGALNSKLFREINEFYKDKKDTIELFCIWKKALEFFSRLDYQIVWTDNLKDDFWEEDLVFVKNIIFDSINSLKYKEINLYYNYFQNSMSQTPSHMQLFPLNKSHFGEFLQNIGLDVEFNNENKNINSIHIEPSSEDFYEFVYKKFVFDMLYGAVLQNKTWEHASRMIAMKSAKDNSIDIQNDLRINYNKQRQWAVTQEISEIVWAKAAME